MNYIHSLRQSSPVQLIGNAVHWLAYWIFGEVIECARIAYNVKHLVASEFMVDTALLLMGFWLLLPSQFFLPLAFTKTIQMLSPVWLLGLMFIVVARVAIHCTLKTNYHWREVLRITATVCWCFMMVLNLSSHAFGVGTLLLFYMTYSSASLAWRLIKINAAEKFGVLGFAKSNR